MKKVLFTATVDSHILHFHLPYLKMFKEKGYEVHVATNTDEAIPFCDIKHKVCFERSPFKKNNLKAIKQMEKILLDNNFDIVHTHTPMGSVVTRLAYKKVRNKVNTRMIYTAHGFHFYKGAPLLNWVLFYPVEKYLSKYTDTLITINKEDYELAKKKFKKCRNVEYVPGVGIDEDKFNFTMTKSEKLELRKSLGLKENDFVLIYPAEISKRKRHIWLINALESILNKNRNMHLLLPGSDSLNGEAHRLVGKLKLTKQIHFLGYRTDIPKLLRISDLAISSAKQEGLPVNIMEAMYAGLPIVATDCRGNRDLVKDHVNGYLIGLDDIDRYKESVEKIYNSNGTNTKFSDESQYIIKEYLLDKIMEKMKKIYFNNDLDLKKKRINWIDNLKAYAIFCIVFGHATAYCKDLLYLHRYLYSFHVPIFFVISGFLYRYSDKKMFEKIKKYINKYIVPYFIYSFIFLIPYFLLNMIKPGYIEKIGFSTNWGELIFGIFYGTGINSYLKQNLPLWFLPCFFITSIIFELTVITSKKLLHKHNNRRYYVLILLSIVAGYISSLNYIQVLPFGISTAISLLFFMYFGMILKNIKFNIPTYLPYVMLIVGWIINFKNGFVSCMTNEYNNYFLFLISAIMTISALFALFTKYDYETIFTNIGKNSLYILIFHKPVLVIFQLLLGKFSLLLTSGSIIYQISFSFIISIISIVISIYLKIMLDKLKKRLKRGEKNV